MKYFVFIPVLFLASCFSSRKQKTEPIQLTNLADSAGYALGVDVASSLQSRKMTSINQSLIRRALEGFLKGDTSLIDENECFMVLNDYSTKMMNADTVVEKDNTEKKKRAQKKIRKKLLPRSINLAATRTAVFLKICRGSYIIRLAQSLSIQ